MNQKIVPPLTGVPETLLLPLLGRALFSQTNYSPIKDEKAYELLNKINYDFKKIHKRFKDFMLFSIARAYHFDETVKEFLKKYPNGPIVNLGAGLETAFYRIDNGQVIWIDMDLPEVIQLRNTLLPSPSRVHNLVKSILDYSWMDEVSQFGSPILFLGGGFFIYFSEQQVKDIFTRMATRFYGSEIIFDSISKAIFSIGNRMFLKADMHDALMNWSINNTKQMETWSPHIKVIEQIPYFKAFPNSHFPFQMRIKMYIYNALNLFSMTHLLFV